MLCATVCCNVLQYVAVCCSDIGRQLYQSIVLLFICCSVLQCVAMCCSVLQRHRQTAVPEHCYYYSFVCSVLQCVVVRFSVLQCVAVRFGVLQRHTLTAVLEHCYYSITAVHLFEWLGVLLSNSRDG